MCRVVPLLTALVALVALVSARRSPSCCRDVDTIDRSLTDDYCDQPLFATFLPKTEENMLLDNVCYTFFPLPDDPNTFQVYESRVFCDGSSDVISSIGTDLSTGINKYGNPYCTKLDIYFGYAGCDTYLVYQCNLFGSGCEREVEPYIYGVSPQCRSIGLSCLRKVEEIVSENCLPECDYYVLPMKLPNRCVTQQRCVAATSSNAFYKTLGLTGPLYR